MAYTLQFDERTVVPYLLGLDLSLEGREVLSLLFHNELSPAADTYSHSPERRLFPGSDCFRVDLLFRDPMRRVVHHLRLLVSDAAAAFGVLRIVYAEDETRGPGF